MSNFLNYSIEASIIMAIFYMPYYLLFSRTTFFLLNRYYLVGSMLSALIFPLINISLTSGAEPVTIQRFLEPITVYASRQNETWISAFYHIRIIQFIYISGTFIFSFFLLLRIFQLYRLIRRHGISRYQDVKIVAVDKDFAPASFFNYVFLSESENYDEIMDHEKVHIQQGHSIDILLIEMITIMMWFNPFIWIYRSSIRNIHEYLADEETLLKGYDRINYQHLVFENTFGARISELAVNFNYSPLKQRLKMMTKNKSNQFKKGLYLIVFPLMVMVFVQFSCKQATGQENKKKMTTEEKKPVKQETVNQESNKEIFTTVDEMPLFNGGQQDNFRKYIAENLVYPEEAAKQKITGKVYVQFVVSNEGDVEDVKVVRGVDPLLDAEAMRVIKSSPKWTPGKIEGNPVNVQFTFPINFALK